MTKRSKTEGDIEIRIFLLASLYDGHVGPSFSS